MLFRDASNRQLNVGLAILRLVVGVIFIAHGGQKIFVYGLEGVAGSFGQMGVPMAGVVGPFIAFLEFFGGFALIAGLLTRLASLGLASTMIGAIVLVHLKAGFFAPNGIEFPLMLLGAAAVLTVTGAGAYSVDYVIARRADPQATSLRPASKTSQRAA
jgi:putative oxidoreductase